MKEFDIGSNRLDEFYMSFLKNHVDFQKIVKLVLILSRGSALVGSGVSTNEDILIANMKKVLLHHNGLCVMVL